MRFEIYKVHDSVMKIPIAESYRDCISLIMSDEYRLTGHVNKFVKILWRNLRPYSKPILFWFRLSSYRGWAYPICSIIYKIVCFRSQIHLPSSTKVGYGLYIGHKICMVINSSTLIGNNVNLSQFLNIGTNHDTPAIIGDNVYIGPNVNIVEDVIVGNNTTIGAGAVVTKDVPESATIAGVPAKVLNYNAPGRYINNRYRY